MKDKTAIQNKLEDEKGTEFKILTADLLQLQKEQAALAKKTKAHIKAMKKLTALYRRANKP